ncbi:MAG: alpha/beta fold hydrolase [Bacillota bacterium]
MNLRKYGTAPYKVAVVHGGPGAAGTVKPVAEELSKICGVLEPLQTEMTINGQLEELKKILEKYISEPVILVGHSWGAMLIYLFAAKYSDMVKKIILVSSGLFVEKHFPNLNKNRDEKLTAEDREELIRLRSILSDAGHKDINTAFAKFGRLMEKLDAYEPIDMVADESLFSYEIYSKVWPEAHEMRRSGQMAELGKNISCEVVAIHGDNDSHPIEGIRDSLEETVGDFTFYELKRCGHSPWAEVYARDDFYKILRLEILK